jgi:hypothetical protein
MRRRKGLNVYMVRRGDQPTGGISIPASDPRDAAFRGALHPMVGTSCDVIVVRSFAWGSVGQWTFTREDLDR